MALQLQILNVLSECISTNSQSILNLASVIRTLSNTVKYNYKFHDEILRRMDDEIKELIEKVDELQTGKMYRETYHQDD